ncbi:MAG TPA: hypothetical protein PK765_03655 [bacterium]|nr:hypothetical protein [bacterium]
MRVPFILRVIFNRALFLKIFALLLLGSGLWLFRGFIGVFFITFIFSYLFLDLGKNLHAKIIGQVEKKTDGAIREWLVRNLTVNTLVTLLYISFVIVIVVIISTFVPKLVEE